MTACTFNTQAVYKYVAYPALHLRPRHNTQLLRNVTHLLPYKPCISTNCLMQLLFMVSSVTIYAIQQHLLTHHSHDTAHGMAPIPVQDPPTPPPSPPPSKPLLGARTPLIYPGPPMTHAYRHAFFFSCAGPMTEISSGPGSTLPL